MTAEQTQRRNIYLRQVLCPHAKACQTGLSSASDQMQIVDILEQEGRLTAGKYESGVKYCDFTAQKKAVCCSTHVVITYPSLNRVDFGDRP